jgi:hypothetical protein
VFDAIVERTRKWLDIPTPPWTFLGAIRYVLYLQHGCRVGIVEVTRLGSPLTHRIWLAVFFIGIAAVIAVATGANGICGHGPS